MNKGKQIRARAGFKIWVLRLVGLLANSLLHTYANYGKLQVPVEYLTECLKAWNGTFSSYCKSGLFHDVLELCLSLIQFVDCMWKIG